MDVQVWMAYDRNGRPVEWSIATRRKAAMERATEVLMGFREYERLGTTGKRWKHCYQHGARLVRCIVIPKEPQP